MIDPKQMDNIAELIISICVRAESRNEITEEEKKAILTFTSNGVAAHKVLSSIISGEIKI